LFLFVKFIYRLFYLGWIKLGGGGLSINTRYRTEPIQYMVYLLNTTTYCTTIYSRLNIMQNW